MALAVLLLVTALFAVALHRLPAPSSGSPQHGPGTLQTPEDADRVGAASGGAALDRDRPPSGRRRRRRSPAQGRRPAGPGVRALSPAVCLVPPSEPCAHGPRPVRRPAGTDRSGSGRKTEGRGPWTCR